MVLKSIVVSVSSTSFSALAFKEDVEANLKKVASMGFDVVELALRDPHLLALQETQATLEETSLSVVALGTGQAFGEEKLSFTSPYRSVRKKAIDRIKDHMSLGEKLKAQVIIGLIRGIRAQEMTEDEAEGLFIEAMQECADHKPQVTLTVEPINRYETNLYPTIGETVQVIEKMNRKSIKVLADTFHMNIEEPSMEKSLLDYGEYISHLHIADSNRWAPGLGHTDFDPIFKALQRIGYEGAISAEILPEPSPKESALQTIEFLKAIGL